jgi:APA family basic amino acid/polyamine antiporter
VAGLKRTLGLFGLTAFGVGVIIGAGVYSVVGAAAGEAREGLWLSFVIGAAIALLTGLSYAELATALPKAGAEFIYLQRAAPRKPWLATVVGYVLVFATGATAATVSLAFGGYLQLFADVPVWAAALCLLAVCTLVNIAGIKESMWVNVVFTGIEVLGLLIVIAFGFGGTRAPLESLGAPLHAGILTGAAVIFFVYLGFEEIANLAEEARQPDRDLPRAIAISLVATTVLYVLVALAIMTLLPPAELAGSESPLADAVGRVSGGAARWLGLIALVSTANTCLIAMIAGSRMLFSMARDEATHPALATLLARRQTPWIAAIVAFGLACLYLPLGKAEATASLSSFGALLAFASVNAAAIVLRYTQPKLKRPFRIPLTIGRLPLPAVAGLLSIGLLLTQFTTLTYAVGLGGVVVGFGLYALFGLQRKSASRSAA